MDICLLREQYRSSRDAQRRHSQVLLHRTDEPSEAVSIVPVTQGLTSSWEPNSSSSPALTFDPGPSSYDPWHVHLDLHRRRHPAVTVQITAPSPETTNSDSSSRRSSSSSDAGGSRQDVDSTPDSLSGSRPASPRTNEEDSVNTDRSRGDPDQMDPVQVSEPDHSDESKPGRPGSSRTSSDESSTPVASITCSPSSSTSSLHEDLQEDRSAGGKTRNSPLWTSSAAPWRASRKSSAPALRFTRQLSVGGASCSAGVHQNQNQSQNQNQNQSQNQNYHPFPNRKTPRISEAARRLGMYSSF